MLILWTALAASAQGLDHHHPDIPSTSIAVENGPGALWVNPANLAYDPDPRWGVFVQNESGVNGRDSIALTAGIQGLQVGLHNMMRPDAANPGSMLADWSLDYATSFALPERLSFGMLVSWRFVQEGNNYVGYDAGGAWRPLPWFGMGVVTQNVGDPDPDGHARPRTVGGIALRPLGNLALLGLEGGRSFGTGPTSLPGSQDRDSARAALRLRPVEGLYFTASADLGVDVRTLDVGLQRYGAGVEVYFGGQGGSYHQGLGGGLAVQSLFLGTGEPGESLFRPGRRVQILGLEGGLDYQPRGSLLMLDPGPSYLEVMERMRRAEEQRSVRIVVLHLKGAGLSWAQWEEVRQRMFALRAQGKTVVAYLDGTAGNGAYFAATAADRIALHPAGELGLVGLSMELQNMRGLLDMVGVQPQFVRRSEYKSGPEGFTQHEPTPPNLEAMNALIDDLMGALVDAVELRAGSEDKALRMIDEGPWTPEEAQKAGLVDALLYPSELAEELELLAGGDVLIEDMLYAPDPHSPWDDPAKIAIIYVDGAIVDGESSGGGLFGGVTAGADTIVRAIERASADRTVRAIVLRVDSPGGSALASDRIQEALERAQESDKPVVVSMGGVAASGGYYVAAGADAIFADPSTITGSIGVYGGKFSTSELFDNIGIEVTGLRRGRNANLYSGSTPWDAQQREKMQAMVDDTYMRFKQIVSDGRGLTMEEVEEVARGRVWSAQRAVEIGLVDELGSLQDAIAEARDRAGIKPKRKVGLVSYSNTGSMFESLAPSLIDSALGPVDEWVVASLPRPELQAEIAAIESVLPAATPALLQLQSPETTVWMVDPWLMDLQIQ